MTTKAKETPAAKPAKGEAPATDYIVLEHAHVGIEHADGPDRHVGAWVPIPDPKDKDGAPLVVAAKTTKAAIDAAAGGRGGLFRPVSLRAWKGAERRAEQTVMQAEAIE